MKRSIGITILGWVIIISTILFWPLFYKQFITRLNLLIYNVLYSTLSLVIGIGILQLRSWARIIFLYMITIQMVSVCYRGINYIFESGFRRIVGIIDIIGILSIVIFLFWFLNKKSIKEQFNIK